MGGGGWVNLQHFLELESDTRKQRSVELETKIKGCGFSVKSMIDESPGYIGDRILEVAKKENVDLIGISSQVSSVGATLFGSVGRDVVRGATCPIWINHIKA